MAYTHTIGDETVSFPIALASVDPGGVVEQKGQVTLKMVDITEYEASSAAILTAGELGLKVIYGCIIKEMELHANDYIATPNAAGTQVVVFGQIAATDAELGAVNCGELAVITWGEILGTSDNV